MTELETIVLRIVERVCTTDSGFETGYIADLIGRQPGHESNRQHGALISRQLRSLEAMGKVRRLDDLKPTVWCVAA